MKKILTKKILFLFFCGVLLTSNASENTIKNPSNGVPSIILNYVIEESFLTTPSGAIRVLDATPKTGTNFEKMICVQGGPGRSCRNFLYVLCAEENFKQNRYKFRIYDPINTGKSDCVSLENITLESEQNVLDCVIKDFKQDHEKIVLYGVSWGAGLVALWAARYSKEVKHLFLVSPLLSTKEWVADSEKLFMQLKNALIDLKRYRKFKKIERLLSGIESLQEAPDWLQKIYEKCFLVGFAQCQPPIQYEIDAFLFHQYFGKGMSGNDKVYEYLWGASEGNPNPNGPLAKFNALDGLREANITTSIIIGMHDEVTLGTANKYAHIIGSLCEKKPQVDVFVVPKASHTIMYENPKKLAFFITKALVNRHDTA